MISSTVGNPFTYEPARGLTKGKGDGGENNSL